MKLNQLSHSLKQKLRLPSAQQEFDAFRKKYACISDCESPQMLLTALKHRQSNVRLSALVREYQSNQSQLASSILILAWLPRLANWQGSLRKIPRNDALSLAIKLFLETIAAAPSDEMDIAAWMTTQVKRALRNANRVHLLQLRKEECTPIEETNTTFREPAPSTEEQIIHREDEIQREGIFEKVLEQLSVQQRQFIQEMLPLKWKFPQALRASRPELSENDLRRACDRLRHQKNRLLKLLRRQLKAIGAA